MIVAMAIGAIALGVVVFEAGRHSGAQSFWNRCLTDRRQGHWALEKLGEAHRVKIELVELP